MKTGELAVKGKLITSCSECPHKSDDDIWPGPVMICGHPIFDWADRVVKNKNKNDYFSPYNAAILHNQEMFHGYPDLCPLFNGGTKL